jgi:hypothetical protein
MLMRDYPTKIKLLYEAFLVLLGVGGLIAGDYLIVGLTHINQHRFLD